jgi:hypothetical protein
MLVCVAERRLSCGALLAFKRRSAAQPVSIPPRGLKPTATVVVSLRDGRKQG